MATSNIETQVELELLIQGSSTYGNDYLTALQRDAHYTDAVNSKRFNDAYVRFEELLKDKNWIGHHLS